MTTEIPEKAPDKPAKGRWHFRLWLILTAAAFLFLLITTQFLPGGRRSFLDWLPAVAFLFTVSVVAATAFVTVWLAVCWLFRWRNLRWVALVCGCALVLASLVYVEEECRRWPLWNLFRRHKEANGEHFDSATLAPPRVPHEQNSTMADIDVRVNVDATKAVRIVDARLFGVNTPVWDSLLDTPETIDALRDAGIQALRFHAYSDEYHWASGTIGASNKPSTSFQNFVHVATNLQAQVFITVNYGSGTSEEAAAWVRYANLTNHCGFKYWEIGNELFLSLEHDENSPPHDPVLYATRACDYIQRMKAADPTIKVGVVVLSGWTWLARVGVVYDAARDARFGESIREGYLGWTPAMLATMKQLHTMPDFLDFHSYRVIAPGWENDASLLPSSGHWAAEAAPLRRMLKTYFGTAATNVELLCTENNSVAINPGKQSTSIVNGLYLADSFGQIAQTEFNSFLWWDLRNSQDQNNNNSPALYGRRQYGDYGIMFGNDTRYPTFYAFKLLKYFARDGDRIVHANSDNKLLSIYAALRADGSLALLVINKSPAAALNAHVSIAAFKPESRATVYSYGIPQDEAARTGKGSPDIEQTSSTGVAASFSREFQPYSATVMVLSPRKDSR